MNSKNAQRVSRGMAAVNSYRKRVGFRSTEDTFLVAAVALIADILHAVEENGGDANAFSLAAWDHFSSKKGGKL